MDTQSIQYGSPTPRAWHSSPYSPLLAPMSRSNSDFSLVFTPGEPVNDDAFTPGEPVNGDGFSLPITRSSTPDFDQQDLPPQFIYDHARIIQQPPLLVASSLDRLLLYQSLFNFDVKALTDTSCDVLLHALNNIRLNELVPFCRTANHPREQANTPEGYPMDSHDLPPPDVMIRANSYLSCSPNRSQSPEPYAQPLQNWSDPLIPHTSDIETNQLNDLQQNYLTTPAINNHHNNIFNSINRPQEQFDVPNHSITEVFDRSTSASSNNIPMNDSTSSHQQINSQTFRVDDSDLSNQPLMTTKCNNATLKVNVYNAKKKELERWESSLTTDKLGNIEMLLNHNTQHTLLIPQALRSENASNAVLKVLLGAKDTKWRSNQHNDDVTMMTYCVYVASYKTGDKPFRAGRFVCGVENVIELSLPADSEEIFIVTSSERPPSYNGNKEPDQQWRLINLTFELKIMDQMIRNSQHMITWDRPYKLVSRTQESVERAAQAKAKKKAEEMKLVLVAFQNPCDMSSLNGATETELASESKLDLKIKFDSSIDVKLSNNSKRKTTHDSKIFGKHLLDPAALVDHSSESEPECAEKSAKKRKRVKSQ